MLLPHAQHRNDDVQRSDFENAFKIAAPANGAEHSKSVKKKAEEKAKTLTMGRAKGPTSVLDMTRARNLGIATRRLGMSPDDVVAAVIAMDTENITPEKAELLRNDFFPQEDELAAIKERVANDEKPCLSRQCQHLCRGRWRTLWQTSLWLKSG